MGNPNNPGVSEEEFKSEAYPSLFVRIDDDPDVEFDLGDGYTLLDLDEAERLGKHLLDIVAKKRAQS